MGPRRRVIIGSGPFPGDAMIHASLRALPLFAVAHYPMFGVKRQPHHGKGCPNCGGNYES
jgi:hypothetical protein